MIEGIDIENFGSFKNFQWDTVRDRSRNHVPFRYLNILYGRNCSGKTTLSRIVRALETGVLPPNYVAPAFRFHMDGETVTPAEVEGNHRNVRVYNRDFVEKHLSFLRRPDGTIDTFAIFGTDNRDIAEQIEAKAKELGSVEGKAGVLFERVLAATSLLQAQQTAAAADEALDGLLIKKANSPPDGIKHRREFGDPDYTKKKLRDDIAAAKAAGNPLLAEGDARALAILVGENALPIEDRSVKLISNFPAIASSATELLSRRIAPSLAIRELLDDAALQAWAQTGMHLHRDRRTTCGFCQQTLPGNLWEKLDAHFNEASNNLSTEISACREQIGQEFAAVDAIYRMPHSSVYAVHRDKLAKLNESLYDDILRHQATLKVLAELLQVRQQRIFEPQRPPSTPNYANAINETAAAINAVVAASNDTTATLEKLKSDSRRRLLLNEVARFASDIQYEETVATNRTLRQRAEQEQEVERALGERVHQLQSEIKALRERQHDERRAAARVSELLERHFGQQRLRLLAVQLEDSAPFTFHIVRDNTIAHNLSDGECSIIAFCYFLAKLEEPLTLGKRPILWIDDPISSLDSNHIFFLFSLIETLLTAPEKDANGANVYRYSQLFISTHNLDFLKYLRRLSLPRKSGGDKEKDHVAHFLVAKRDDGSMVECMPDYLVKYTTEFNFLFDEIHTCVNPANQPQYIHAFFNFGHNLRRFLEAYLYFKYPFSDGTPDQDFPKRIRLFFGNAGDDVLVSRISHEGSHLMGAFDRAMRPTDSEEISKVARLVLTKVRAADRDQYNALLNSIGKACPL